MNFAYKKDNFKISNSHIYPVREFVVKYIKLGFAPIPVHFMGKKPIDDEWQKLRLSKEDVDKYFPDDRRNIGIALGNASGGQVDVDLDDNDAVQFAAKFLPSTEMVFGRASRPGSHQLYRVPDPGKPRKLAANSGGTIVELRSNGQQTVFPGSIHESGEPITFEKHGEPARSTYEKLEKGIIKIALATILLKRWKRGIRHDLALRMAGSSRNADGKKRKWNG